MLNAVKPAARRQKFSSSKSVPAKNEGTKIKKFLMYCFTLISLKYFFINQRRYPSLHKVIRCSYVVMHLWVL